MVDAFASSEAIGLGSSITTKDSQVQTAKFMLGDQCAVFTEEGNESIETLLRDEEMAALLARDGLDPDAVRAHAETARRALQQRARLAEAA